MKLNKVVVIAAMALCSCVASAQSYSFPHFNVRGKTVHKQTQTAPVVAEPVEKAKETEQPQDSVAAKEKTPRVNPYKVFLEQTASRVRKLGDMPYSTEREKKAKERARDAILEDLKQASLFKFREHGDELSIIIRQLNSSYVLQAPEDDKNVLGEVRRKGSRSYCKIIINQINKIIKSL